MQDSNGIKGLHGNEKVADGRLLTILEGWKTGKRHRGRERIQMIDDIVGKELLVKTKRKAEDRRQCGRHQVDCP